MRVASGFILLALLASSAVGSQPDLDGPVWSQPTPDNIVLGMWPYPNCDPMGIDYDAATGLVWVADQGGVTSQGECPPDGQIYTFDPTTGLFTLEFVTSQVIGFEEVAANGIEIVGDFVYIADFNGDVTNFDDSIYKFTKTGMLVQIFDISATADQVVGLGYRNGIFYATTVGGTVYEFTEVGTEMVPGGSFPIGGMGGGGLDWDELCGVWLHVDFRNTPPEVVVFDENFIPLGTYPAETTNPIGVTWSPFEGPFPTQYVMSRDDILTWKTNDHPPCAQVTPVDDSSWGTIKSIYR